MGDNTDIEWTRGEDGTPGATWNPLSGCTRISDGCTHCYIARTPPFRMAHRRFDGEGVGSTTGLILHPARLEQPLRWRKPRRIFVNSLSDLFHDQVPDDYIAQVFAVMAMASQHTFQLLTKRHARMRSLLNSEGFWRQVGAHGRPIAHARALGKYPASGPMRLTGASTASGDWLPMVPLPNVWLGVSVENQQWADIRIPALLKTPAAVRWLSCEPLLGPVDLTRYLPKEPMASIAWCVAGGESGPGARLMQLDWARSLRDQCVAAGVPFFLKQWGEWQPQERLSVGHLDDPRERHGEVVDDGRYPSLTWRRLYRRVGKKAAGRELDGRYWDEMPMVSA